MACLVFKIATWSGSRYRLSDESSSGKVACTWLCQTDDQQHTGTMRQTSQPNATLLVGLKFTGRAQLVRPLLLQVSIAAMSRALTVVHASLTTKLTVQLGIHSRSALQCNFLVLAVDRYCCQLSAENYWRQAFQLSVWGQLLICTCFESL